MVAAREYLRWVDGLPPSRYYQAILDDRQSEDYRDDPDAWNGPDRE